MFSLFGSYDDRSDDTLSRDAVLASMASPAFSDALALGRIWPPLVGSPRSELRLRKEGNHLYVVPVNVGRAVLEALMPVIQRAAELAALPRGWNSYDARPVSAKALHGAIEFLLEYAAPDVDRPALVPTVRGGLQLEWHNNGLDVEVEVAPDGHVCFFAEDAAAERTVEVELAGKEEWISQWLTRVSG